VGGGGGNTSRKKPHICIEEKIRRRKKGLSPGAGSGASCEPYKSISEWGRGEEGATSPPIVQDRKSGGRESPGPIRAPG